MNRRKFLLGSTAVLTGTGLLAGTQGHSQVESQRAVRLQVEDDENAYLRLVFPDATVVEIECERKIRIPIQNRTKEKLTGITVQPEIVGDGIEVTNVDSPDSLATGEEGTIVVTLECGEGTDSATAEFGFEIEVEGESGDTLIQAHRGEEISLECSCPETETNSSSSGG